MLPIKAWTIYYADGSKFTSQDGTWAEAPPFGVQAVVYYHVDGVDFNMDRDVYYYRGEEAGGKPWKMGLFTDGESYWRVQDLVMKETTP
jgi:hypothetical protein